MAASNAGLGYGCDVEVSTTGLSPDVLTPIDEVFTISPPTSKSDQIDVTHMQSPNRRREFIAGLTDGGEFSCEMNFVPGGATDDFLFAIINTPVGQSKRRFIRLSFPNGTTWFFQGRPYRLHHCGAGRQQNDCNRCFQGQRRSDDRLDVIPCQKRKAKSSS